MKEIIDMLNKLESPDELLSLIKAEINEEELNSLKAIDDYFSIFNVEEDVLQIDRKTAVEIAKILVLSFAQYDKHGYIDLFVDNDRSFLRIGSGPDGAMTLIKHVDMSGPKREIIEYGEDIILFPWFIIKMVQNQDFSISTIVDGFNNYVINQVYKNVKVSETDEKIIFKGCRNVVIAKVFESNQITLIKARVDYDKKSSKLIIVECT